MTQGTPHYPARPGSALPLILAGAAFVTAIYLVWDRVFPAASTTPSEPRIVTPRGELAPYELAISSVYEANLPSVVHITSPEVAAPGYYGYEWLAAGMGTGFIWDERGYVVTNYHVVQARSKVLVRLDNQREYWANLVGARRDLDIAVIKLVDPPPGLRPVTIGSSADLRVGQTALAIGNPFGLDHSLTTGVISATNRTIKSVIDTPITGVIQVDAAINPGNSGGPLLDSAGRLIGMNTAIKSPSGASAGIGFAVPVDTINQVVPELMAGRTEESSLALGITVQNWRNNVMIMGTQAGSGAEEAGLRGIFRSRSGKRYLGDILVSVAGKPIREVNDIAPALRGHQPGDRVEVVVIRGLPDEGKRIRFEVEAKSPSSFR